MNSDNKKGTNSINFSYNSNANQTNLLGAPKVQNTNKVNFGIPSSNIISFNNCNRFIYFSLALFATTSPNEFPATGI